VIRHFLEMNSSLPIEWLTLTKLVNFIFLEIPDPCSPNPCENEGRCKAELNTFECECVPGFKGKTCKGTLIGLKLESIRNVIHLQSPYFVD
jgi:hypothetical protein